MVSTYGARDPWAVGPLTYLLGPYVDIGHLEQSLDDCPMGGLLQLGQRYEHHRCVSGVIHLVYIANLRIQQYGYHIEVAVRDCIVHGCVALK